MQMITEKIKKKNNIWYFDDYFKSLRKSENEIAEPIRQFVLDPKGICLIQKKPFTMQS